MTTGKVAYAMRAQKFKEQDQLLPASGRRLSLATQYSANDCFSTTTFHTVRIVHLSLPIDDRRLTIDEQRRKKYGQASRLISTSQLNASLRFHIWPINLVVYHEPSEVLRPGTSHLVEGFTLRCLQRFSLPDVATRRCRGRDNRYTRGPSNPVLSY